MDNNFNVNKNDNNKNMLNELLLISYLLIINQINETAPAVLKQLSSYSITSILGEQKTSGNIENEPGFLRSLLKSQEQQGHYHLHHHNSPVQTQHSPQHQGHSSPHLQDHVSTQPKPHCSPQQHSHRSSQHRLSPQPVFHSCLNRLESTVSSASYLNQNSSPSIHQTLYGLPILPSLTYRTPPVCWMHYTQPVHYSSPMPLYAASSQPPLQTPSFSPPAHHIKDYRERTSTPPSGK